MSLYHNVLKHLPRHHVRDVDPQRVKVDPERLQFRSNINERGVTGHLATITTWDPEISDEMTFWLSAEDEAAHGEAVLHVADGHQRLGLSLDLATDMLDRPIRHRGILLKETDGWTSDLACIFCALKNIAQSKRDVNPVDVARVLRHCNGDVAILSGITAVTNKAAKDGIALTKLEKDAWIGVLEGIYEPEWGVVVGGGIPQPERHKKILQGIRNMPSLRRKFSVHEMVYALNSSLEEEDLQGRQMALFTSEEDKLLEFATHLLNTKLEALRILGANFRRLTQGLDNKRFNEARGIVYSADSIGGIRREQVENSLALKFLGQVLRDPILIDAHRKAARLAMEGVKIGTGGMTPVQEFLTATLLHLSENRENIQAEQHDLALRAQAAESRAATESLSPGLFG